MVAICYHDYWRFIINSINHHNIYMEKKIKDVFDGFPGVDYVFVDDKEVYFDERENCHKVTREEFFSATKKSKKVNNE